MYRDQALSDYIQESNRRTDEFESKVYIANIRRQSGLSAEPDGKELFNTICAGCHLPDKVVSAPTSKEIIGLYAGKPDEIVAWAKKPGKKRPRFVQMPSMAHLGEKKLRKVAEFMATLSLNDPSALAIPVNPNAIQNFPSDQVFDRVLSVKGNPEQGKQLFSTRTCVTCHAIGATEQRKAPDLTGIGKSQNKRLLLQNILNPSASFAKGFEMWTFLTLDDEVVTGSIAESTDAAVKIRTADGSVRQLSVDDIDSKKSVEVSPMPKGLIDALTPEQVADLLEYISNL